MSPSERATGTRGWSLIPDTQLPWTAEKQWRKKYQRRCFPRKNGLRLKKSKNIGNVVPEERSTAEILRKDACTQNWRWKRLMLGCSTTIWQSGCLPTRIVSSPSGSFRYKPSAGRGPLRKMFLRILPSFRTLSTGIIASILSFSLQAPVSSLDWQLKLKRNFREDQWPIARISKTGALLLNGYIDLDRAMKMTESGPSDSEPDLKLAIGSSFFDVSRIFWIYVT